MTLREFFRKKTTTPTPTSSEAPRAITFGDPFADESSIGNILKRMGVLTHEQLLAAVGQKAHYDEMLLGALLKQMGVCSDEQVARALMIQTRLRSGEKALAELEMLEARQAQLGHGETAMRAQLETFNAGEKEIEEEIDRCRQEQRDRGEKSGLWMAPALVKT